MKKSISYILTQLILSLVIMSCDKEPTKTNVLVKVLNDGVGVDQAVVYVKDGAKSDPNVPISQYNRSFGADAIGETNLILPFNDYYILARRYSPTLKKYLIGGTTLHLVKTSQLNSQKIRLNIQ